MSKYSKLTNSVAGGSGQFRKNYVPQMTEEIKKKISKSVKQRHREGSFKSSHKKLSKALQGKRSLKQGGSPSKFVGVVFAQGKWVAYITHMSRRINLGTFENEEQAALAYDEKAIELFGNEATLNLPNKIGQRKENSSLEKKTSRYKGICFASGKWQATIFVDGKKKYLGSFETEELAFEERQRAESLYRASGHRIGKG